MKKITKYFSECVSELRQVQWPTKHQTIQISIITIVFVFSSAIFIGALDFALTRLLLLLP
ncbi:MAG: preprotein translocase subunit SecE [Candidatus Gracilibacteria bacterium]|jgi:preprotein translocase subunit SecE|nr:preprotein translocase subunit SecE [Candidatus Gracilibacteria bacterium]